MFFSITNYQKGAINQMKNINFIRRSISIILVALLIASAALLAGCKGDHDHDHDETKINPNIGVLVPSSKLVFAGIYPNVAHNDVAYVKQEGTEKPIVSYLRVGKIDGDQIYCTSGNTTDVNYIIVDCPLKVKVGDYILCNTNVYHMSSERFGFNESYTFGDFYVVFGDEMQTATIISQSNVADIFASGLHGEGYKPTETEDPHAGHNHGTVETTDPHAGHNH